MSLAEVQIRNLMRMAKSVPLHVAAMKFGISQSQIQELAEGTCLDVAENILIFGNPGTGKTHSATALGREWCMRGASHHVTTASALVQDL